MNMLCDIDPYNDCELAPYKTAKIIGNCEYIIGNSLLNEYKKQEEGYEMVRNLLKIAGDALVKGKGLVSIGG